MKKILIIGATSAIAAACARLLIEKDTAAEKTQFFLVARQESKLQQTSQDLIARGAEVSTYVLDLNQITDHSKMLQASYAALGEIDIVLIAHGSLPNQTNCEQDVNLTLHEFSTNGLSVIALLTLIANHIEKQGKGTIAVISSVAGDRGRPTNYVYGSAKAAVTTFCDGLRARLFKSGVHVLTIKPGFVDTPMTHDLALPKLLVAQPEKVANDIVNAIKKKKNTLYTPWFWQIIMLIVKNIPTAIFKRAKL